MTKRIDRRNVGAAHSTASLCSLLFGLGFVLAAQSAFAEPVAIFQGLGDLPGGGFSSGAKAVSADGSVVVGGSTSASGREAFRWTSSSGMVGLGYIPSGGFWSGASGVSADGSVVVGVNLSHTFPFGTDGEAFRWTLVEGMVGLGDLPGSIFTSTAHATSSDGSVVVGNGNSIIGFNEAFRWTADEGMVGLGSLPGGNPLSIAHDTSFDGSAVVGAATTTFGLEAFRWTLDGGMVGLGYLSSGGFASTAFATSADGSVVVGSNASYDPLFVYVHEAFRWTAENGMVGLGVLPDGFNSKARAISADGSVIVGDSDGRAFLWTAEDGMRSLLDSLTTDFNLDLTGWWLGSAYGISADGRTIVGQGVNPDGNHEAWIATVPILRRLIKPINIEALVSDVEEIE